MHMKIVTSEMQSSRVMDFFRESKHTWPALYDIQYAYGRSSSIA